MHIKKALALLFTFVAVPVFAGEDRIEVASIDRNNSRPEIRRYVPPAVSEHYEYYDITGNSEQEIGDQLSKKGIIWDDGSKYHSVTSWYIHWEFRDNNNNQDQSCSPDSFRVRLDITYRFPRWSKPDSAPAPLVEKWDGYLKNIMRHEQGHRDIAKDIAADFTRAVIRLPKDLSCADLDREVKAKSRELMAQLNADQHDYDCSTGHGATQGAIFP